MQNTPTLTTERLVLRRFSCGDAAALLRILGDREVNTFLPWFPLETLADAEEYLQERYLDFYAQAAGYRYAVCLKSDDLPVGYVHVADNDSNDFGYGLRKDFWRQGIITEACKAVIERLRSEGIPYVTATHDVNNPRSGSVMKRLGMVYRYSYEERWMPKDILVTFRMYQLNLDGRHDRVYRKYWDGHPVHFVEDGV